MQRIVIRGRRRELGLDAAGLVSLAEARELVLANRNWNLPGRRSHPRTPAPKSSVPAAAEPVKVDGRTDADGYRRTGAGTPCSGSLTTGPAW